MNTKELIAALDQNEELKKKFEGINQPEKFYEVAKENGLTDDFETMKATAMEMVKSSEALNEDDLSKLESVSGGMDSGTAGGIAGLATTVVVGVGASFLSAIGW